MSEIKDRQDAASDIDPIVAALADDMGNDTAIDATGDSWAAAAVEGLGYVADADPAIDAAEVSDEQPEAEDTAVDEAGSHAAGFGNTEDAPFDFVAAGPVDAVASVLSSDAHPALEDAAVADLALASQAMPAELATYVDEADEADSRDEAEAAFAEGLTYGASPVAPAPETIPFDQMTAAYADTIVEVEGRAEHDQDADDDGPLLDGELEDGIASVFAALHAAAQDHTHDDATIEPLGDLEAAEGVTFRLLGELDRLWHRAA